AVLALRGPGESRIGGLDPAVAHDLAARLTDVGVAVHLSDDSVTIRPGVPAAAGALWPAAPDLSTELAGLVLGLIVPGTVVAGTDRIDAAVPGFLDTWRELLAADEYLLPGSALLPGDYLAG